MKLTVLGRYRSSLGEFEPGQELSLSDEAAALLLRDSPGSFALAGSAAPPVTSQPASDPTGGQDVERHAQDHANEAPEHAASSPEADDAEEIEDDFDPTGKTASGLVVPDRRARGGRRRTT